MKTKPLTVWATRDRNEKGPQPIVHLWLDRPRFVRPRLSGPCSKMYSWWPSADSTCESESPILPVALFKVWVGKLPRCDRPMQLQITALPLCLGNKKKTSAQRRADKFYHSWL